MMDKELRAVVNAATGIYARVARKLKVSPSMVSKVASGTRVSAEIEMALREDLKHLKKELDSYFASGGSRSQQGN